ncbi:hypothetical protein ACHWQZ_G008444 [Mnemiopsis leidyi]
MALKISKFYCALHNQVRLLTSLESSGRPYMQGQLANNERQYFYFIDHQGMLFLDDARMKNFTSCFKDDEEPHLSWGDEHGLLKYPLNLSDIAMCPKSGRVYHPAPYRQGGIGLIKSKLAIELSNNFVFEENRNLPSGIRWNDKYYALNHQILKLLDSRPSVGRYSDIEE